MRFLELYPQVGDFVIFNEEGQLISIRERKNFLIRPKVSNVDLFVIVTSYRQPTIKQFLLDKFLMMIESQDIKVAIVFTKEDLAKKEDKNIYSLYKKQGYNCFSFSNKTFNKDYHEFIDFIKNKLVVFSGQSGVGKTTLLNNILELKEETQTISKSLNRGKHTTRVTQIHESNNFRIVDTPGFSSINYNINPKQASKSFWDFKKYSSKCKFRDCMHINEQDCYVKKMVKEKIIDNNRYQNYLKIINELIAESQNLKY